MKTEKKWTIIDLLKTTTQFFNKKQIVNPRLNAERLLAFVLNLDRVKLYLQFERLLTATEIKRFREVVQRRAASEPLQYIIGECEFMGLPLRVTPDVLIPRPETEVLVEEVLKLRSLYQNQRVEVLDIGTGSGCIAITIAYYWPECTVTAIDNAENSIKIARQNAEKNRISRNIKFYTCNILECGVEILSGITIVVSNPPYVSQAEFTALSPEIRDYEPSAALTDFANGLKFYRQIFKLIANSPDAKFVYLELNAGQADKIVLSAEQFGFKDVQIIADLNNLSRVLKIIK